MRRFTIALFTLAAILSPTATFASDTNGELCAVQTWDEAVVISVHRAGYGPASEAPRNQVTAAAGQCTNLAATDGWMAADKDYDAWVGQSSLCAIDVAPGLVYRIHAGTDGFNRAYALCRDAAIDSPQFVTWL